MPHVVTEIDRLPVIASTKFVGTRRH